MILTDADRIRGLLGRYCRLVDAGDFAGVGALMADAVLRDLDGNQLARGAEEVAALYAALVVVHADGTPRTQHVVTDTTFEEPAADGSVRATSTYVVLQATDEHGLRPIVTGTYVDRFGRVGPGDTAGEGSWRFLERRFGIGLSGDLTQHLTFAGGLR